jgi:ribose/xylose/arabinose/galactoside ABC-type transport system permease subunit
VWGLPFSIILLVVVGVALTLVMRNTPFGYRVRQIGSNPDAAEFSGIPVRRTRTMGFVLAGFMAGLAGIVALTFFTVGDPQSGGGIELFAVAGAVIGGTPLAGGKATVFGAIVGAILLTAVAVGLVYFQIPATWAQFATGAVILGAVSVDGIVQRQRRRAARKD